MGMEIGERVLATKKLPSASYVPIGLSGLFAELAILLVPLAALASPDASRLGRLLTALFAFVCAWLLAVELDALRAPGWTMVTSGAVIVVSIVVIVMTLHLWTQGGDDSESDPGRRRDHGGGGPRRPRPALQPGDNGNDPSWWPEFERQLALYTARGDEGTHQPATLPARASADRHDSRWRVD